MDTTMTVALLVLITSVVGAVGMTMTIARTND